MSLTPCIVIGSTVTVYLKQYGVHICNDVHTVHVLTYSQLEVKGDIVYVQLLLNLRSGKSVDLNEEIYLAGNHAISSISRRTHDQLLTLL